MLLQGSVEKNVYLQSPTIAVQPRSSAPIPYLLPFGYSLPIRPPAQDYGLWSVPPEYNPLTPDTPIQRTPFLPPNFLQPQVGTRPPSFFNEPVNIPIKTKEEAAQELEQVQNDLSGPPINPLLIVGLLGVAYYVFNKKKKGG